MTDRTYTHCYVREVGEMRGFGDIRYFQRLFTDDTSEKVAAPSVDKTQGLLRPVSLALA